VRAGTGFAGWHGGIADSFRNSPDYLQLVGGTFATHPGGYIDYSVDVVPEQADHQIVAGLPARWDHHHTEQYWVLACPLNEVLVTTRFEATDDSPWREDVVMPELGGREMSALLSERWPDIPVLFTSGYTGLDVVRRGLLEEGREFIQKPLAPEALARRVREMMDARLSVS
jgi:hypothetical protein